MRKTLLLLSALFLTLTISGCEQESKTAVSEVHWDRDMCARCVMVVSDRMNTVQVKNPDTGKKYIFDDIGCMILWFKDENITWQDRAVIWVTDNSTGKWIDARKAFYDTHNVTPMAYGFCAHADKDSIEDAKEVVRYEEVVKRVIAIGK